MTRILLLGAGGQLGTELRRSLPRLGELVCATRSGALPDGRPCERIDLEDASAAAGLVAGLAPDVVVNAAAYTAVDRAEAEPESAYRVNAAAPAALAAACRGHGALLLHYSTDYVFDGDTRDAWREDDPVAPLNVYGASKLAGEQAVRGSGARHLVLRTSWVYAGHGRNFLRTMLRLAEEGAPLRVVDDQFGAPTPAAWLADATARLLAAPPSRSGLWHAAATGCTSWYGFAAAIFELAVPRGLLKRLPDLQAVTTAGYPAAARRPACSCLDTARMEADFGIRAPQWREALASVLDAIAAGRGARPG
ncbi:dTDP-4-dehydrorhamnose reductase [Luteimonas sp. RD2P54]|uniref:dTDP-4-dehydrorhamnose reductase n=1 Tax=Luteimonas endophytica TaxID=3042023 RepID=A0ABT6JB51_9GAMM|nr:dTDP-4-dehydrorhamnose reductase [Luteimonas endophytica]MDH5824057.1 dTDP-4-dehydrorhamnose reductase [Luteimonas endophytica]